MWTHLLDRNQKPCRYRPAKLFSYSYDLSLLNVPNRQPQFEYGFRPPRPSPQALPESSGTFGWQNPGKRSLRAWDGLYNPLIGLYNVLSSPERIRIKMKTWTSNPLYSWFEILSKYYTCATIAPHHEMIQAWNSLHYRTYDTQLKCEHLSIWTRWTSL